MLDENADGSAAGEISFSLPQDMAGDRSDTTQDFTSLLGPPSQVSMEGGGPILVIRKS